MGLSGAYQDGGVVSQGVFYTDVSSREAPSLWSCRSLCCSAHR